MIRNLHIPEFLGYCSWHVLDLRNMHAMSGSSVGQFNGFVPLPCDLEADADFIYPRRSLLHQFENVDKHQIYTVVFKVSSLTIDADNEDTSCSVVSSELKLMSQFLSPSEEQSGENTVKNNSLQKFFTSYYYEIIYYLTLITRYKININVEDLKVLFPNIKNINERQVLIILSG